MYVYACLGDKMKMYRYRKVCVSMSVCDYTCKYV